MGELHEEEYVPRPIEEQLFWQCLNDPAKLVLGIFGVGGIGKSWYLAELVNICAANSLTSVYFDLRRAEGIDYLSLLLRLRAELDSEFFPDFDKYFAQYKTQLRSIHIPTSGLSSSEKIEQIIQNNIFGTVEDISAVKIEIEHMAITFAPDEQRIMHLEWREKLTNAFVAGMVELTKKQRVVVVFDAFEIVEDPETGIFMDSANWLERVFLPELRKAADNLLFVIARRTELTWHRQDREWRHSLTTHELEVFDPGEMRVYLAKRNIKELSSDAEEKIYKLTRGHIGCVALAVDYIKAQGIDLSLKTFDEYRGNIDAYLVSEFLIEHILRRISPEIREGLVACSILHYFNVTVIKALLGPSYPATRLLEAVREYSFVRFLPDIKSYSLHETIREIMIAKCRMDTEDLFVDYHCRAKELFDSQLRSASDNPQLNYLRLEHIYHSIGCNEVAGMLRFMVGFEEADQLHHLDYAESLYHVMDEHQLSQSINRLWLKYYGARLLDAKAIWGPARDTYMQLQGLSDDRLFNARVASSLAGVCYYLDLPDEAIRNYEESVRVYGELGDEIGVAWNLRNIANIYRVHSGEKMTLGIEYCQKSLEIFRSKDDKYKIGWTLKVLGALYRCRCEYQKALATLEEALKIWESLSFEYGVADTLGQVADTYRFMGQLNKAHEAYLRVQEIHTKYNDVRSIAWSLQNSGEVYRGQGHLNTARPLIEESLLKFKTLDYAFGVAWGTRALGEIDRLLGYYDRARSHYMEAQVLFRKCQSRKGYGWVLHALGKLELDRSEFEKAIMWFGEALKDLDTEADEYVRALIHRDIAKVHHLEGRTAEVWEHFDLAERSFSRHNNEYQLALCSMFQITVSAHNSDESVKLLATTQKLMDRENDVYHGLLCRIVSDGLGDGMDNIIPSEASLWFAEENDLHWLMQQFVGPLAATRVLTHI